MGTLGPGLARTPSTGLWVAAGWRALAAVMARGSVPTGLAPVMGTRLWSWPAGSQTLSDHSPSVRARGGGGDGPPAPQRPAVLRKGRRPGLPNRAGPWETARTPSASDPPRSQTPGEDGGDRPHVPDSHAGARPRTAECGLTGKWGGWLQVISQEEVTLEQGGPRSNGTVSFLKGTLGRRRTGRTRWRCRQRGGDVSTRQGPP